MGLESCIADIFDAGNTTTTSGTIGTPTYPGYELQADGSKVWITTTTPPLGVKGLTLSVTTPRYIAGLVLLETS